MTNEHGGRYMVVSIGCLECLRVPDARVDMKTDSLEQAKSLASKFVSTDSARFVIDLDNGSIAWQEESP